MNIQRLPNVAKNMVTVMIAPANTIEGPMVITKIRDSMKLVRGSIS